MERSCCPRLPGQHLHVRKHYQIILWPLPATRPHECPPLSRAAITRQENLIIDGLQVELRRKAIKHMHLRVIPPDGRIVVSAPRWLPRHKIEALIHERAAWISERRAALLRRQQQRGPIEPPKLTHGGTIDLLGQRYPVIACRADQWPGNPRQRIMLADDRLLFHHDRIGTEDHAQRQLQSWYRARLRQVLDERVPHWSTIVGRTPDFVGIKRMKTRWGSCNPRARRIWLNLELVRMPPGCIDHVLVHELCHLHERHHNRRFYALMDQFLPDWRDWTEALDRYGISGL